MCKSWTIHTIHYSDSHQGETRAEFSLQHEATGTHKSELVKTQHHHMNVQETGFLIKPHNQHFFPAVLPQLYQNSGKDK